MFSWTVSNTLISGPGGGVDIPDPVVCDISWTNKGKNHHILQFLKEFAVTAITAYIT